MADVELLPDERERRVLEERRRVAAISLSRALLIGGTAATQPWVFVDYFLEHQIWLFGLVVRQIINVGLASLIVYMLRNREMSARAIRNVQIVSMLVFGVIGAVVARAEHYALYVLGFSMIVWGSGVANRWSWRTATLTFTLVLIEFALCHVIWSGPMSVQAIIGAMIYMLTVAVLMVAKAATANRMEERTLLMELRLQQRNEALSRAITELHKAQARLVEQEKLSALGRLLAGLSHEVNNPVNVILNTVDSVREGARTMTGIIHDVRGRSEKGPLIAAELEPMLADSTTQQVSTDLNEAIGDMEISSRRLQNIHRDLRAFVRGDAQERAATDLVPGLLATVGMVKRAAPSGIQWKVSFSELPPVLANPGQANQIFFNLLQNAADALGASGTVEVSAEVREKDVTVAVADDGPGVPADLVSRLFEPFFTTKPVGKGTGLGLAISREMAERGDGALDYRPGDRGARFCVTLPRAPAE